MRNQNKSDAHIRRQIHRYRATYQKKLSEVQKEEEREQEISKQQEEEQLKAKKQKLAGSLNHLITRFGTKKGEGEIREEA